MGGWGVDGYIDNMYRTQFIVYKQSLILTDATGALAVHDLE